MVGSLRRPGDHRARVATANEVLGNVREGKVVCETPAGEVLPGPTKEGLYEQRAYRGRADLGIFRRFRGLDYPGGHVSSPAREVACVRWPL
jgi:hypothetical protein